MRPIWPATRTAIACSTNPASEVSTTEIQPQETAPRHGGFQHSRRKKRLLRAVARPAERDNAEQPVRMKARYAVCQKRRGGQRHGLCDAELMGWSRGPRAAAKGVIHTARSPACLPAADGVEGPEEHQHVQRQVVADGPEQQQL